MAAVHVASWRAAYRGLLPAAYLATLSVDQRAASWRTVLEGGGQALIVARCGAAVVGLAAFGRSSVEDVEDTPAHEAVLSALYLLPEYWSRGVGRALWLEARTRLRLRGVCRARLWVLADNHRAIRFYRAAGFRPDPEGERLINLGGAQFLAVRYLAELCG